MKVLISSSMNPGRVKDKRGKEKVVVRHLMLRIQHGLTIKPKYAQGQSK